MTPYKDFHMKKVGFQGRRRRESIGKDPRQHMNQVRKGCTVVAGVVITNADKLTCTQAFISCFQQLDRSICLPYNHSTNTFLTIVQQSWLNIDQLQFSRRPKRPLLWVILPWTSQRGVNTQHIRRKHKSKKESHMTKMARKRGIRNPAAKLCPMRN